VSMPKHCATCRKDGQPCTAPVRPGSAYCFAHDPAQAEARQAAREKGGRGKATAARDGGDRRVRGSASSNAAGPGARRAEATPSARRGRDRAVARRRSAGNFACADSARPHPARDDSCRRRKRRRDSPPPQPCREIARASAPPSAVTGRADVLSPTVRGHTRATASGNAGPLPPGRRNPGTSRVCHQPAYAYA
jgi:hypothetical protein